VKSIVRPSSLIAVVADFLKRHVQAGAGVVAISGGPDSVCLASILRQFKEQGLIPKLVLAHLNHQLRGSESDADEAFVTRLAETWQLRCRTERVDVAAAAQQAGANLEATARRLRYEWLTRIAQEEGASWVATGHSADDQAETVLFRLLRGSGLQGLAGMAGRRPLAPGIDLLRPLLSVRREAILACLREHQQDFREDVSNEDTRWTRNRLRHDLLPSLARDYNPAVYDVLCRLADQAREVQEEVMRGAARLLQEAELPRAGDMTVLRIDPLAQATRAARREVFRLIWERESWPMRQMDFAAWSRLAVLVDGAPVALDMPGGVKVQRVGHVVQLGK
jgi:tRNA(Ile)-lysidine synthase